MHPVISVVSLLRTVLLLLSAVTCSKSSKICSFIDYIKAQHCTMSREDWFQFRYNQFYFC